ncbi:MAG: septal ring lytic transglycosylase RlpA family protein [Rhodospirillaceae bacterium]|nr:MAG: septal ring lytic transglycosylase RlpA family protein [Rhodospirillaceae bacterium]
MTAGDVALRAGLIGVLLTVSACSTTRGPVVASAATPSSADQSVGGRYKVGNPYQVDGVWYYPSENYAYREEGTASWYGDDFNGKRTANGERFDMNAVSAAHPTLPMPSMVKVTNLDNGRELKVRVNDRGPYKSRRIIDLSRRAAQLLGFDLIGTARVRVEIDAEESLMMKNQALRADPGELPKVAAAPHPVVVATSLAPPVMTDANPQPAPGLKAKPQPEKQVAMLPLEKPVKGDKGTPMPVNGHGTIPALPPVAAGPGVYIQAGAFSDVANAHRLEHELAEFGNAFVLPVTVNNRQLFRVRLGPLGDDTSAQDMLGRVKAYGYDDAQIVRY